MTPILSPEAKKLNYLKGCINHEISQIDGSRIYYRKKAFRLFISTTLLSSLVTLLLSLKINSVTFFHYPPIQIDEVIRITALVITSTITIISAYSAFFNHKEVWIANNQALNRFYKLNFDIEYAELGDQELTFSELDNYKNEYQNILDELNSAWEKNRSIVKKQTD